jgi:hypothetical protein
MAAPQFFIPQLRSDTHLKLIEKKLAEMQEKPGLVGVQRGKIRQFQRALPGLR